MTMIIKPAKGRHVRDPISKRPLSPEGEKKPRDGYWLKRLKEGDVELIEAPHTEGAKAEVAKKTDAKTEKKESKE